jgi:hypothetical protein
LKFGRWLGAIGQLGRHDSITPGPMLLQRRSEFNLSAKGYLPRPHPDDDTGVECRGDHLLAAKYVCYRLLNDRGVAAVIIFEIDNVQDSNSNQRSNKGFHWRALPLESNAPNPDRVVGANKGSGTVVVVLILNEKPRTPPVEPWGFFNRRVAGASY